LTLIFILCLEILFITIRSDDNINCFKIENNEFKLTSYSDDASNFLKNKVSAEILLSLIQKISKISGLEVNRSKSDCLLLDYELGIDESGECFLGIAIVNNLKILITHYFGKDRLISTFKTSTVNWKRCERSQIFGNKDPLQLLVNNVLINSLINSTFLFNS
jgi:hypothetical protein